MRRRLVIQPSSAMLFLLCVLISCNPPSEQPPRGNAQNAGAGQGNAQNPSGDIQYATVEMLAKRLVLYKLARQEGDIAPFTALTESIQGMNVPEIARQLNGFWWTVDWAGARLTSLPSTEITALEPAIFPLIATRLEQSEEADGWVLFVLGYDPDVIRVLIANTHNDWLPEERELYLKGQLDDCLQVWCVNVAGEWKILAHLPCQGEITRPVPPPPPPDIFGQGSTAGGE